MITPKKTEMIGTHRRYPRSMNVSTCIRRWTPATVFGEENPHLKMWLALLGTRTVIAKPSIACHRDDLIDRLFRELSFVRVPEREERHSLASAERRPYKARSRTRAPQGPAPAGCRTPLARHADRHAACYTERHEIRPRAPPSPARRSSVPSSRGAPSYRRRSQRSGASEAIHSED